MKEPFFVCNNTRTNHRRSLIPSQHKLSFLKDLDLKIVVINLKNLAKKPGNENLILKTLSQLRQINKQFLQFTKRSPWN